MDQQPQSDKAAADDFLASLGTFKGLKTFKGSPSTYAIIAEKNGYLLAIAPKIVLGPVIGIDFTVRAQGPKGVASDAAVAAGVNLFGFPGMDPKESSNYARTQVYVPIMAGPATSAYEAGRRVRDNKLVEKIVDEIAKRVEGAGSELSVPKEIVVEYVTSVFEDRLPSAKPKEFVSDFKVCVGYDEISKQVNDILSSMYPKKEPGAEPA